MDSLGRHCLEGFLLGGGVCLGEEGLFEMGVKVAKWKQEVRGGY